MKQNDKFADVCNYYLFDGKMVIKEDELEERDITELGIIEGRNSKFASIQKLRDILKRCVVKSSKGVTYMIIGIENQTDVNYAMVIRNMLYDALNYASQVEGYVKGHREKKDLEGAEFLSGLTKEDKLMPVVTITIYWNSGKWDGARSLHEMLDTDNSEILEYVSDYKLNLIVPNDIEDFGKFKTELGKVLNFINYSEDKEEIRRRYLNEEGNEENRFSRDAVILLNEYVKADIRITEEGEDKDMCKGIKDLMDEARGEGREEGEDRLATLIIRVKESGRDIELMDILKDNVLRAQLYLEYNIK
ncbi:MAG: transposase [Lachnospiraceae bacterium]|nr:transposase [Lachnospiraceae bacterium]